MKQRNNSVAKSDTPHIQQRVAINRESYPTKDVILSAMKDAEREGHTMDAVELAVSFGITTQELECILSDVKLPVVGEDVLIKIRSRVFKTGSVHAVAPHNTVTIVVEDAPHVAPDKAQKFYYDVNVRDMHYDATARRWEVQSNVLEVLR